MGFQYSLIETLELTFLLPATVNELNMACHPLKLAPAASFAIVTYKNRTSTISI